MGDVGSPAVASFESGAQSVGPGLGGHLPRLLFWAWLVLSISRLLGPCIGDLFLGAEAGLDGLGQAAFSCLFRRGHCGSFSRRRWGLPIKTLRKQWGVEMENPHLVGAGFHGASPAGSRERRGKVGMVRSRVGGEVFSACEHLAQFISVTLRIT